MQEIEELFRKGRLTEARERILSRAGAKLARPERLTLANLARRAELPDLAVRLLGRVIRSSSNDASPLERAEYAASLAITGASFEAEEIFRRIREPAPPLVSFLHALCKFTQWDYEGAVPLLRRYLESPGMTDETRMRGRIRLAAALFRGLFDFAGARAILEDELSRLSPQKDAVFYKHASLLLAQAWAFDGTPEKARAIMAEIEARYDDPSDSIVAFWAGVFALKSDPGRLSALREKLEREGQAELVRAADLYRALHERNDSLLVHLYYGSPWVGFHKRLLRYSQRGDGLAIPPSYDWVLRKGPDPYLLEVSTGQNNRNSAFLKSGQLQQRLLAALCSDFYAPQRMAGLFAALYPGQYHNPVSAPSRVHRAMSRLRDWFEEAEAPLEPVEDSGGFRLRATAPCVLRIRLAPPPDARLQKMMRECLGAFGEREFSSEEAARLLGVSARAALNHLRAARDAGLLWQSGQGRGTRYLLTQRGAG